MIQRQYIYKDESDFVKQLLAMNRESREIKASCVLIHVFSTITEEAVITRLCEVMDTAFPTALYIGCTTNANISEGRFMESGICITFSMFTDPTTKIGLFQKNIEGISSSDMVKEVPTIVSQYPNLKFTEILVSSYGMMSSNLTRSFERNRTNGLVLFGGGAYTGEIGADSLVFAKGFKPDNKALVMAFYEGEALHIDARHITGWKPLGHDFKITSAKGNVLMTLDGRPAFEIYQKYLDIENNEHFEDNAIEFPFMCRTRDGKDIMRTPISSRKDGSIVMFSEIDSFPRVRLSYGDKSMIADDIVNEARQLCEFRPDAITLYSCVARRSFWADDIDRESAIFQNVAPTCGFYTSGELMSENDRIYHHNETLLIVGIREGDIDSSKPAPTIEENTKEKNKTFINRFAKFISTATDELEETNKDLDNMIKQVLESRMQAEAANRAKSDFLANMSHEIRTPINAILGFDTMILRESGDEAIIDYANDIMRAGSNLLAIINDILDLSKIESGKMNIVDVEYELSSLILDVVNMMTMKAEEKGLKVEVDVDKDIPGWLYGDDVRIRQIIVNLMNNAVKYTETGTITLAVHGTRDGEYETLHISVKDTGMGIKPEDMNKLFEKFARIEEERNHNVEGTGLGMNITISLLSMMNSKLNVTSEYGKGSCFSFDIKQKILRNEPIGNIGERSVERRDETAYTSSFTAPDANVLVVDDNTMNREVIVGLLKKTKIHFDQADGGYACLEKTREFHYDLILLDHMMPDLDGIKTLHKMREDSENKNLTTPVVCMTANAISGAKEEYIWEGFDAYISKPVKPEKLEQMLAEMLPQEIVLTTHDLVPSLCPDGGENNDKAAGSTGKTADDIPRIDGIDNEVAISNLIQPEMVLETMDIFMNGASGEAAALLKFYDIINAEDISDEERDQAIADYRVKVHAMKSSALTIGAVMVSNMAKFLEYSARDKKVKNISSVTGPFIEEWNALTDRMKEAFGETQEASDEGSAIASGEELIELLDQLNEKISEMDIDSADEIMKQLGDRGLKAFDKESFTFLRQAVTNIDLDEVDSISQELKSKLKT